MDKQQKQVEEMTEDLQYCIVYQSDDSWQPVFDEFAENFYNAGYRKIPETAVVILDEEMEEFAERLAKSPQMQKVMHGLIKAWQKEMAEKIMNEISGDTLTVSTRDYGSIEVVPLDRISEICENIVKGDKQ